MVRKGLIYLKKFSTLLILLVVSCNILHSEPDNLKGRKNELNKLNRSINETRNKIKNISKREKNTLKTLDTYQKHISNVKRYINLLDSELNALQDSISYLVGLMRIAGENREGIREDFTKLASMIYLNGESSPEELIYLKRSPEKEIRNKYFIKLLAENSTRKISDISMFMDTTQSLVKELYDKSMRSEELRKTKQGEQNKLNRTLGAKKKLLNRLKQDKTYLTKKLRQKQASAKKLTNIIAELARKSSSGSTAKKYPPPKKLSIGYLSWPVKSKKVLRNFGKIKNKNTNTIFDNPGIDISAKNGSAVTAAADGKVSLIHWLPGYGSLVIVDHGKDIRTVYANLSSINVKKGQKVSRGTVIGKSGESVDGAFVHFEVWKGGTKLNPRKYMK